MNTFVNKCKKIGKQPSLKLKSELYIKHVASKPHLLGPDPALIFEVCLSNGIKVAYHNAYSLQNNPKQNVPLWGNSDFNLSEGCFPIF